MLNGLKKGGTIKMKTSSFCFVIMPFRPELNYFFLFIKDYLERKYKIQVQRGDNDILTKPLMEKIRNQIIQSDFIIADITGKNPNVFYELGIAHANGKKVLFLTQEDPKDAPVDIRQFEFILYNLSQHTEFLSKLDNAMQNIFVGKYQELYKESLRLLDSFNKENNSKYKPANIDEFRARLIRTERSDSITSNRQSNQRTKFLLPKIVQDSIDIDVMESIVKWLSKTTKKTSKSQVS